MFFKTECNVPPHSVQPRCGIVSLLTFVLFYLSFGLLFHDSLMWLAPPRNSGDTLDYVLREFERRHLCRSSFMKSGPQEQIMAVKEGLTALKAHMLSSSVRYCRAQGVGLSLNIHVHFCIRACLHRTHVHMHMRVSAITYIQTYVHTYIHMCIYIYIYIHMHVHIRIHILIHT